VTEEIEHERHERSVCVRAAVCQDRPRRSASARGTRCYMPACAAAVGRA
jgi:hypothetical protein